MSNPDRGESRYEDFVELARFVPGEKLFTRPLVDRILEVLDCFESRPPITREGLTGYFLQVVDTQVTLFQEENPSTDHPGLLIPKVDAGRFNTNESAIGGSSSISAVFMEGISVVKAILGEDRELKTIDFVQEEATHIQRLRVSKDGGFSSLTNLK